MTEANVTVSIFDTTLRDGAQSLPKMNQFPEGAKAEIADHIANLGVNVIEAGFPRTSGDAKEVNEVAKEVGNNYYEVKHWGNGDYFGGRVFTPVIAGLSRTTQEDVDTAWEAVQPAAYPRIHTFISTDAEHMAAKFKGKSPNEVLEMGRRAVRHAVALTAEHPGASVEFSAEAASTTDPYYLERVIKMAVDEGADVVNLPDTVGQRNPFQMREFYGRAIAWIVSNNPEVTISAHNHNDIDMATMNSLSLVMAAASYSRKVGHQVRTQAETTICGLGERAGNTDVFPFVAGLFKFTPDFEAPVYWQFSPGRSVAIAEKVMAYAGLEVDRQNPIVGKDTVTHRSGIHSDGVIKGGAGIYTPQLGTFYGHETDARHEEGRYQGANGRRHIQEVAVTDTRGLTWG